MSKLSDQLIKNYEKKIEQFFSISDQKLQKQEQQNRRLAIDHDNRKTDPFYV